MNVIEEAGASKPGCGCRTFAEIMAFAMIILCIAAIVLGLRHGMVGSAILAAAGALINVIALAVFSLASVGGEGRVIIKPQLQGFAIILCFRREWL